MARIVASGIPDGSYVNLGVGMPTLVAGYLPRDRDVILHSENGIVGMAALPPGQPVDADLINATKEPVALLQGASISDHVVSFAMIRGGHIDLAILGAFQVSEAGDIANWDTGAPGSIPAVGGAMDLAVGAKSIFVMMEHVDRQGASKIVKTCTYPVTGRRVVDRIYTDLAVIDVHESGLQVAAIVEGLSFEDVQAATAAALALSPQCATLRAGAWLAKVK